MLRGVNKKFALFRYHDLQVILGKPEQFWAKHRFKFSISLAQQVPDNILM